MRSLKNVLAGSPRVSRFWRMNVTLLAHLFEEVMMIC